ncbi:hypothetical protein [Candidatus Leptofilum sp.]|uniref:hypothetical protein n=1 Tax=Candidatus Leptofilum sp. TaxID=3241576 RepID=UPI003B5956FA
MTTTTTSPITDWNIGRILRIGAPTTVGAMLANALLATLGNLPTDIVPLAAVVGLTFAGGFTAIIGYALLSRFLTQKTTNRVMLAGVVLVLLGFAYNPFTIPNVTVLTVVILQIMHLVAALPAIRLTR